MFLLYILLVSPFLSPVVATHLTSNFNIRAVLDGITDFILNFGSGIKKLLEIFSLVISEDTNKSNSSIPVPEDAFFNFGNLTAKYGYDLEEHSVVTEDGYVLKLHRLSGDKKLAGNKTVVLLMHGLTDSSDSWILQGPDKALGYILADENFDVWLGNARGNKYSLKHKKWTPADPNFLKFTWEEIGVNDVPAMIDYILNVTNKDQLYYIGHSQGTTSFYVMNSLRPEYNKKVKLMFSLAPVAWTEHIKSPMLKMFSPAYNILGYWLFNFNTYAPSTEFFNKLSAGLCTISLNNCKTFWDLIVGSDHKYINSSMISVIAGHLPSGSSTLQFVHYGQLIESGRFCRYDHGLSENLIKYQQATPPDYNLSNVKVSIVLYYSENDWLSDPKDVDKLIKNLPNVVSIYNLKDFNHWDYLYAEIAKEKVYKEIITQIRKFELRK